MGVEHSDDGIFGRCLQSSSNELSTLVDERVYAAVVST